MSSSSSSEQGMQVSKTFSTLCLMAVCMYFGAQLHELSQGSGYRRSLSDSTSIKATAAIAEEEQEAKPAEFVPFDASEYIAQAEQRRLDAVEWPWCYKGNASPSACANQSAKFAGSPCYWQPANLKCKKVPGATRAPNGPPTIPGPPTAAPEPDISCAANGGQQCPKYPPNTLATDWTKRFSGNEQCYFEFHTVVQNCTQICDTLFYEYTKNVLLQEPWGEKTAVACKIGCGFAKQETERKSQSCMARCKNTVWNFDAGNSKCNWNKGLGIAVFEIEYFGSGKACEFGCIIGNQRDCPACDRAAGFNTPGVGYYPF